MMLPWVGFANRPLSRRVKQRFQAVSLSSVSLITIALSSPFPRTKRTRLQSPSFERSSFLKYAPSSKAFSANRSFLITSRAAIPTAAATGLPPKVLPCEPGVITCITSSLAKTAEIGYTPPEIALPRIKDFRGLNQKSFDENANYSFGVKEHVIFPEVNFDKVDKIRGLDVTMVTSSKSKEGTLELLKEFNFPLNEKRN